MDKWLNLCIAILMSISTLPAACASGGASEQSPTAAELVQAVRQGENWIHDVNSFYLCVESTWTHSPEVIAARRARLQNTYPDETLDPNKWPELRRQSQDRLEIAFDKERLRYLHDDPGNSLMLRVWDGRQVIAHEKYVRSSQEQYYRANKPDDTFREFFSDLSWLRAQPHSFWWWHGAIDPELEFFGRPEHFQRAGRETFRGIDCHVLEYETRGRSSGLILRWHVGVTDHRLYGVGVGNGSQISTQYWLGDYQQVVPGRWFPMSQGYAMYEPNDSGRSVLEMGRDLKLSALRINERLADELFQVEIRPGVEVVERWFGETRTYTHVPSLTGKPLPAFDGIQLDGGPDALSGKPLLLCFWDPNQRPSRHYIRQLAEQAGQLGKRGIVLIAIQSAKTGSQASDPWAEKAGDFCRTAALQGDSSEIQFTWGVRSLPWLILADARHIVRAQGFGMDELDEKVKQLPGE